MERESVNVLKQCIELQNRKGQDYQNPESTVRQADYYPSGIQTIHEMIRQKELRIRSILETHQANPNIAVKFESLEDSYMDLINYASFAVSWLRGKVDGQPTGYDMFRKKLRVLMEDNRDLSLEVVAEKPVKKQDWPSPDNGRKGGDCNGKHF